jgi:hypothetical protein
VDSHLREGGGIAQGREDAFKAQAIREVQLTGNPVLEAQVEPVATQRSHFYDVLHHDLTMTSLQRLDRQQRHPRTRAAPILFECRAMRRRPFHNHTQYSIRQVPKHGGRVDLQYSPMLAVSHVEVRRRVIVIVHRHDDTEEPTDLGHPRNVEHQLGE